MRRALSLLGTALLFDACSPAPKHDLLWQTEIARSETIRNEQGPEAALRFLSELPSRLPKNQRPTATAEYRRLHAIARLEDNLGNWLDAELHFQECLKLAQADHNARRAAAVRVMRFSILLKLNRVRDAEQALEAAREYARTSHDTSLDRFILHDTAFLLEKAGRFEESIAPLSSSLLLFEKAGEKGPAANVRISLGWAYYHLGQFEKATDEYLAAQAEALPQDQHLCLGHLGNLAFERRDFKKAAEYYRLAAEAARNNNPDYRARWLTNEATAWIELRQWRAAAERNTEALALGDQLPKMSERQLALVNQARIAAGENDTASAVKQLQTLIASASEPGPTLDAYSELTKIHQHSGNATAAEAAYNAGVALIDHQRTQLHDLDNKLSFAASAIHLNQQYVAGLMSRGNHEKAFAAAEAGRARMLRDNLNLPGSFAENNTLNTFRALAARTGAAYLAYWVAPEHSYLWVIAPGNYAAYTLPGESELRDRVDRFQKLVQSREEASTEGAALFQTLVEPALKQLRGTSQVVIVPDGPLYGLNFETLRQGSFTAPYWIENVTLSTAPSLTLMLGERRQEFAPTRRVLLMGDAKEWSAEFPRLLNSPGELDRISAQFPPAEQTRLTGDQANPIEYERQSPSGFRFIHFATHADGNRIAPLESAIILSRADGRGKLTARDVLRLPIYAEVVSISACRSAGAKTYAGEGLVGLAWAFLRAGAQSVVAGLWDVSDYSSPLVMGAFYSGLAHGQDAPGALRAAKLALLKPGSKYTAPYYWGPFLLYRGAGSTELSLARVN